MGLSTVCVYGGTGISEQIAELKRGCEIIVCTPGRMIDMLAANSGKLKPGFNTVVGKWTSHVTILDKGVGFVVVKSGSVYVF